MPAHHQIEEAIDEYLSRAVISTPNKTKTANICSLKFKPERLGGDQTADREFDVLKSFIGAFDEPTARLAPAERVETTIVDSSRQAKSVVLSHHSIRISCYTSACYMEILCAKRKAVTLAGLIPGRRPCGFSGLTAATRMRRGKRCAANRFLPELRHLLDPACLPFLSMLPTFWGFSHW